MKELARKILPETVRRFSNRILAWLHSRPRPLQKHWTFWRQLPPPSPQDVRVFNDRARFVAGLITRHAPPQASILELGSSVGMNLKALWDAGFRNLAGLEISPQAVEQFKALHPQEAAHTRLIVSSIEESIRSIGDGEFDVVFSVRTLAHVHKESDWVMAEVARITRSVLITVEVEEPRDWKQFARNYREVFEDCGMKQIEQPQFDRNMAKMNATTIVRVFNRTSPTP